jgi:hypothetical protein
MPAADKIDSNVTSLLVSLETSPGVLAGSPTWEELEPNSYSDFGGDIKTVARNPINKTRQRKKGVVVDKDASFGFPCDVTPTNQATLLPGVLFADYRRKAEYGVSSGNFSSVATADDSYNAVSGLDVFRANDLMLASGFSDTANNGLKTVVSAASGKIVVSQNLVDDLTPAAGEGSLVQVGHQFASATVNIVASGSSVFPYLSRASGTKDFTQFGLVPGEWVFIGGDSAGLKFVTAANNGWARVRSVAADRITFDKTANTMVSETGTGLTVQIFFGRVLKNEKTSATIVQKTFQFERQLGAPDTGAPSDIQAEYVLGGLLNEWKLNCNMADKLTCEYTGIGTDTDVRDGTTGPKSEDGGATIVAISEEDAFNTSSDVSRFKVCQVSSTNSNPAAFFSFTENVELSVNNNAKMNKAVSVLGSFAITAGTFAVMASTRAYFSSIEAISAVENNVDITMDIHFAKSVSKPSLGSVAVGRGISIDVPLASVADGRPDVAQDTAIMQPMTFEAATASKIDSTLDHTLLMVFWDYLPAAAL